MKCHFGFGYISGSPRKSQLLGALSHRKVQQIKRRIVVNENCLYRAMPMNIRGHGTGTEFEQEIDGSPTPFEACKMEWSVSLDIGSVGRGTMFQ